jgi:hypothetical protein
MLARGRYSEDTLHYVLLSLQRQPPVEVWEPSKSRDVVAFGCIGPNAGIRKIAKGKLQFLKARVPKAFLWAVELRAAFDAWTSEDPTPV